MLRVLKVDIYVGSLYKALCCYLVPRALSPPALSTAVGLPMVPHRTPASACGTSTLGLSPESQKAAQLVQVQQELASQRGTGAGKHPSSLHQRPLPPCTLPDSPEGLQLPSTDLLVIPLDWLSPPLSPPPAPPGTVPKVTLHTGSALRNPS